MPLSITWASLSHGSNSLSKVFRLKNLSRGFWLGLEATEFVEAAERAFKCKPLPGTTDDEQPLLALTWTKCFSSEATLQSNRIETEELLLQSNIDLFLWVPAVSKTKQRCCTPQCLWEPGWTSSKKLSMDSIIYALQSVKERVGNNYCRNKWIRWEGQWHAQTQRLLSLA